MRAGDEPIMQLAKKPMTVIKPVAVAVGRSPIAHPSTGIHVTAQPKTSTRSVIVASPNPTIAHILPKSTASVASKNTQPFGLPSSALYTNIVYPVVAFIIGALILVYVFKQSQ